MRTFILFIVYTCIQSSDIQSLNAKNTQCVTENNTININLFEEQIIHNVSFFDDRVTDIFAGSQHCTLKSLYRYDCNGQK